MNMPKDCQDQRDLLRLIRSGTHQQQRMLAALDPRNVPVDGRELAHHIVMARHYAKYLQYYSPNHALAGDWQDFFSGDISVLLAQVAIEDLAQYQSQIQSFFKVLQQPQQSDNELKQKLGFLFSALATLAYQLDQLHQQLPADSELKTTLSNLISTRLAAAFKQALLYYRDGRLLQPAPPGPYPYLSDISPADVVNSQDFLILGQMLRLSQVRDLGLSALWISSAYSNWADYLAALDDTGQYPISQVYGSGPDLFAHINHLAGHNLWTGIFDQFHRVYARIVQDARTQLEHSLAQRADHAPHYTLFLSFLRLYQHAKSALNTLSQRHLDFYYRTILQLQERPAQAGRVHLIAELSKPSAQHELTEGLRLRAGKDAQAQDVFYRLEQTQVVNRAQVTALKQIYRHSNGLVYAASDLAALAATEGVAAEAVSGEAVTPSWHPFHRKIYQDGQLSAIDMSLAQIGFALASHYLFMADGTRTLSLNIECENLPANFPELKNELSAYLSTAEGWLEKPLSHFKRVAGKLHIELQLNGADPAITGYTSKQHGYAFAHSLPMLLIRLKQNNSQPNVYAQLAALRIKQIELKLAVQGLKKLSLSNDFGSIDNAKPFQPYGASPQANSAFIIGSSEVFQKHLTELKINLQWHTMPKTYPGVNPEVSLEGLYQGAWQSANPTFVGIDTEDYSVTQSLNQFTVDQASFGPDRAYQIESRQGFLRLRLNDNLGQQQFQNDLVSYLKDSQNGTAPEPPVVPSVASVQLSYTAQQNIVLNSSTESAYQQRKAYFYHLGAFGTAEQHPYSNSAHKVTLLPQFSFVREAINYQSRAELYIGLSDVRAPQQIALLFQVLDGSADPLSLKPKPHIHWSYLSANEWHSFAHSDVEDGTGGGLHSGIIRFAIPHDIDTNNQILPGAMLWLRAAVHEAEDAVCRLINIHAQALSARYDEAQGMRELLSPNLPPETISRLEYPVAAIKGITQSYAGFDGRAREDSSAFYTRVSERLRHKDRAIALWDYERLILQAFPQIYQARCLNHTRYEPDPAALGIYRERAPGHVTIVTIPQLAQQRSNPLRPYTSLGVLQEIENFLRSRLSCHVRLHVRNPIFEEVQVVCKVRLYEAYDESYYTKALQQSLLRFLSPWAFNPTNAQSSSPDFGGTIYPAAVIHFIESLPYVDYLSDLQLHHRFLDEQGVLQSQAKEEVEPSRAIAILVSVPAAQHQIQLIHFNEQNTLAENCLCSS